jgi:hypothetical protein
MSLAFHPLADVLGPVTEGAEFDRLVADVAKHGLHNEITLYQGKILDGRNRYRWCLAAGVEPRFKQFTATIPRPSSYRRTSPAGTSVRPSAPWWPRAWPT